MRIEPSEVLPAERAKLLEARVADPQVQSFLAWRRSLLLLVAVGLLPVVILHAIELKDATGTLRTLSIAHVAVDAAFMVVCFLQLKNWTQWARQRRVLVRAWLLFFLVPFLLYLYPLRSVLLDAAGLSDLPPGAADSPEVKTAMLMTGAMAAIAMMMQLAPKAVSLMPGLLRAALTTKLLLPGASGPGWLVALMAPIYALLMYVVLQIPYQLTGNVLFVVGMGGFIAAQVWLGGMGVKLARPERLDEALMLVKRVRGGYMILNLVGITCVAIALFDLFKLFGFPALGAVKLLLGLMVNVMILTLVSTDLVVSNLARGHSLTSDPTVKEAQSTYAATISHFSDVNR